MDSKNFTLPVVCKNCEENFKFPNCEKHCPLFNNQMKRPPMPIIPRDILVQEKLLKNRYPKFVFREYRENCKIITAKAELSKFVCESIIDIISSKLCPFTGPKSIICKITSFFVKKEVCENFVKTSIIKSAGCGCSSNNFSFKNCKIYNYF